MPQPQAAPKKFYRTLYFRVIVGILLGVILGVVAPSTASQMEPLGTSFINLIRMMIGPIIFFTVVVGIARQHHTHGLIDAAIMGIGYVMLERYW